MNDTTVKAKARIAKIGRRWEHWEIEISLGDIVPKFRFFVDSHWSNGAFTPKISLRKGVLTIGVKKERASKRSRFSL